MDELPGARFPPVRPAPPARVPQTLRVAGEAAFLAKGASSCRSYVFLSVVADSGSGRRAFRASEDPSEAERVLRTHCFGLHRGPRRFWAWLCGGRAAQPPTPAPRPSQPRADGKAAASVRLGGQTSPSAQNEARRHFASTPARQEERGRRKSQVAEGQTGRPRAGRQHRLCRRRRPVQSPRREGPATWLQSR